MEEDDEFEGGIFSLGVGSCWEPWLADATTASRQPLPLPCFLSLLLVMLVVVVVEGGGRV